MVGAGGTRTCVHPHVSRPLYHCATDTAQFPPSQIDDLDEDAIRTFFGYCSSNFVFFSSLSVVIQLASLVYASIRIELCPAVTCDCKIVFLSELLSCAPHQMLPVTLGISHLWLLCQAHMCNTLHVIMYRDPLDRGHVTAELAQGPLLSHWTMETSRCVQLRPKYDVQCDQSTYCS